jgi:hypothetical protein
VVHTHSEYAPVVHTHTSKEIDSVLNDTVVYIPDAIRGNIITPIAGGDVRNLDLDLSAAPLYNAQDEIEMGKFYFKFPYKGIYALECNIDWSFLTPTIAGQVVGTFALKRWTPLPEEEVTKETWLAGEINIDFPVITFDTGRQPLNSRLLYTIDDDPSTHIVEPLFVFTAGTGYAIGFKNIVLRLIERWV